MANDPHVLVVGGGPAGRKPRRCWLDHESARDCFWNEIRSRGTTSASRLLCSCDPRGAGSARVDFAARRAELVAG